MINGETDCLYFLAEERADLNEKALAKCKTRARSASLAPMVRKKLFIHTLIILKNN